jgi:hypothetical protein
MLVVLVAEGGVSSVVAGAGGREQDIVEDHGDRVVDERVRQGDPGRGHDLHFLQGGREERGVVACGGRQDRAGEEPGGAGKEEGGGADPAGGRACGGQVRSGRERADVQLVRDSRW